MYYGGLVSDFNHVGISFSELLYKDGKTSGCLCKMILVRRVILRIITFIIVFIAVGAVISQLEAAGVHKKCSPMWQIIIGLLIVLGAIFVVRSIGLPW